MSDLIRRKQAGEAWETAVDEGGGSAGSPVVRAFPFSFDDAGLDAGIVVYTPTPDDLLLDGWIQIDVGWDGTTPKADFGTLDGGNDGFLVQQLNPVDVSVGTAFQTYQGMRLNSPSQPISVVQIALKQQQNGYLYYPYSVFTGAPIKVVVSQSGAAGGGDPGATQGSAVLYLVTATPFTS